MTFDHLLGCRLEYGALSILHLRIFLCKLHLWDSCQHNACEKRALLVLGGTHQLWKKKKLPAVNGSNSGALTSYDDDDATRLATLAERYTHNDARASHAQSLLTLGFCGVVSAWFYEVLYNEG